MPTLTSSFEELHPLGSLLPLPVIVSYLNAIAPELHDAHMRGVVHGAVCPANMMLSNGTVVVYNSGGTQQPAYMAPEQWRGEATAASDQYALGILVYQWLSGSLPFQGNDLEAQHRSAPVPSLKKRLPTIPARVERVVLKALAKDPVGRYPSVEAFAQAFEQAIHAAASPAPAHTAGSQGVPSSPLAGRWRRRSPKQTIFTRQRDKRVLLSAYCFVAALLVMMIGWLAGELFFPPQTVNTPSGKVHPTPLVHHLTVTVPSPTPTPVLQTIPFTLSSSVSASSSSLDGIKLDTYTASNLSHDLTQQETDGMFLTFTNVSSPCQDVTFPLGQITDTVGNVFFIDEAISLPCRAPTVTIKISSTQYSQTGSFPANALYSITERLSILPEDPGSVLNRLLQDTEQAAEGQFSNDSTDQYYSNQFPAFQFQAQNMLCVLTHPIVADGTLSIAEVVCATFLIDPYQVLYSVHQIEQVQNPGIQTCKLATSTLDSHNSFITFDGMDNAIVSLTVTLKGKCVVQT